MQCLDLHYQEMHQALEWMVVVAGCKLQGLSSDPVGGWRGRQGRCEEDQHGFVQPADIPAAVCICLTEVLGTLQLLSLLTAA